MINTIKKFQFISNNREYITNHPSIAFEVRLQALPCVPREPIFSLRSQKSGDECK
jgi:hypothetical protein